MHRMCNEIEGFASANYALGQPVSAPFISALSPGAKCLGAPEPAPSSPNGSHAFEDLGDHAARTLEYPTRVLRVSRLWRTWETHAARTLACPSQSKAGIVNKEYAAQKAILADVDAGKIPTEEFLAHANEMVAEKLGQTSPALAKA